MFRTSNRERVLPPSPLPGTVRAPFRAYGSRIPLPRLGRHRTKGFPSCVAFAIRVCSLLTMDSVFSQSMVFHWLARSLCHQYASRSLASVNDVLSRVYLLSMLWNICPTWAPFQAEVYTSILPITGKRSLLGTSCSVSTICRPGTVCSFAAS